MYYTAIKNFILVLLLLLVSANPYISQRANIYAVVLILLTVAFHPLVLRIRKSDIKFIGLFAFLIMFEFIHKLIFNLDNTTTIIRLGTYFIASYTVVKATNNSFLKTYVSVVYFLAAVSIFMFVLSYTLPSASKFLFELSKAIFPTELDYQGYSAPTFIIYTFDPAFINGESFLLRNAGFTWEAGAFAFFINIAVYFDLNFKNQTINSYLRTKEGLIVVLALITTFSTAGYLVFFLILLFVSPKKFTIKSLLYFVIILTLIIYSFTNLDFLGDKIKYQIETAQDSQNRFGAAMLDIEDWIKRPIFGWSRDQTVLFGKDAFTFLSHRPNGITNLLRNYGIIYFSVLIYFIYYSFYRYFYYVDNNSNSKSKLLALQFISIILLMAISQLILHKMFTFSIMFLGFNILPKQDTIMK